MIEAFFELMDRVTEGYGLLTFVLLVWAIGASWLSIFVIKKFIEKVGGFNEVMKKLNIDVVETREKNEATLKAIEKAIDGVHTILMAVLSGGKITVQQEDEEKKGQKNDLE